MSWTNDLDITTERTETTKKGTSAYAGILEQADWYEAQAKQKLAKRGEKAVTSTLLRISRGPPAPVSDRGGEKRLNSNPPPSEPDRRVSRIRLSSWWSYLRED